MAFPQGWTGYVELTPPERSVDDFTFLISLNAFPSTFWTSVQADGDDLRATDESNNQLALDRIHFTDNGSSGTGLIAVRYPSAVTAASRIRIWAGNAAATYPAADSDYGQYNAYDQYWRGFWPDGLGNDRTSFLNHLTASGSPTVGGQAGPLNGSLATDLNGSSQYGLSTVSVPIQAPLTLLAWARADVANVDMSLVTVGNALTNNNHWRLAMSGDVTGDPIRFLARNTTTCAADAGTFEAGVWCQATGREISSASRKSHKDTTASDENATTAIPSPTYIAVGARSGTAAANFHNGLISLASLHTIDRGAIWSDYFYSMIVDPDQGDFYGALAWTASAPGSAPTNSVAPALVGDKTIGETLTVSDGTWGDGATNIRQVQVNIVDSSVGWTDIPGATGTTYDVSFATVLPGMYLREKIRRANANGSTVAYSPAYLVENAPAPIAGDLPSFDLIGSKGTTNSITALGGERPYFIRWFNNDLHRDVLPGLPAKKYSAYGASDHTSFGGIGFRADFDHPEDDWEFLETPIYIGTGSQQRETPHVLYDPIGERLLMFVHDSTSNGQPYNLQHQVVLESTDGTTWTVANSNPLNFTHNHSGYPWVEYDEGRQKFDNLHFMSAGEYFHFGVSESDDGETFSFVDHWFPNQNHIAGVGRVFGSTPFPWHYDGCDYLVTMLEDRNAIGNNELGIVAVPIWWVRGEAPKTKGGYYFLRFRHAEVLENEFSGDAAIYNLDEGMYMVQTGRDLDGLQHILVYRASETPAQYVDPVIRINGNGRLKNPAKRVEVASWDAANDAVPAWLTITAHQGTNASNQSAGNYYELKTGSGSNQKLSLCVDDHLMDPTEVDTLEFVITGVTFNPTVTSAQQHQFAWLDFDTSIATSLASYDGVMLSSSSSKRGFSYVSWLANGVVAGTDINSYVWGINDASTTIAQYRRQLGIGLCLRFQDFGTKLEVLIAGPGKDPRFGDVQFYRNLVQDGLSIQECMATIIMQTLSTPWPETWVRFTGLSVYTLDEAPTTFTPQLGSMLDEPILIGA